MLLPTEYYNIYLGNLAASLSNFLQTQPYSAYFVLTDENTHRHCWPLVKAVSPLLEKASVLTIESGEINKNSRTCEQIWSWLLEQKADRRALLLNVGGGVIGDMGGFAAATYKRGIDFVQIPTTLLAQVDAAVGGKVGIDFGGVKNSIGSFQNPKAVFVDTVFLQTLPERQLRSGFAEVIKHALIADDDYWQQISSLTDLQTIADWQAIVLTSLQIKHNIVSQDPQERGIRKLLNFGHTVGHALESYALANDKEPLLHGEAIALGMLAELELSVQKVGLSRATSEEISGYIRQVFSQPYSLTAEAQQEVIALVQNDKKNEAGRLLFSLIQSIGKGIYDVEVEPAEVLTVLQAPFN